MISWLLNSENATIRWIKNDASELSSSPHFLLSISVGFELQYHIYPVSFPLISTHKSHQLDIPHLPNIPQCTWALVNSKPFCWKPKAVCRCAGDNVDGRSAGPNNFAFCAKAASNSWWKKKEMIHRYCWWFRTPAHHLGCTKPCK